MCVGLGALPSLDLNFGFDDVGSSPEGLPPLSPVSNSAETAPLKLRTHGLWYRAAKPPHRDGWLVLGRLSCQLGCQAQGLGMCYLLFQGKEGGGEGGTQNHNGRGGKKGGGQKGRKAAISSSPLVKQPRKRNQRKGPSSLAAIEETVQHGPSLPLRYHRHGPLPCPSPAASIERWTGVVVQWLFGFAFGWRASGWSHLPTFQPSSSSPHLSLLRPPSSPEPTTKNVGIFLVVHPPPFSPVALAAEQIYSARRSPPPPFSPLPLAA